MHSRSFHPSHTLSNCCIGVACVTHECLTILAQTLSLYLFVRASVLQSTECWTLTCPIPASLSFTVSVLCTKNENSYWESFCLYGGDTSRSPPSSLVRAQRNLCLKIDLIDSDRLYIIRSTMGTNMVPCSILFWPGCLACSPSHSYTVAAESKGLPIFFTVDSEPIVASTPCYLHTEHNEGGGGILRWNNPGIYGCHVQLCCIWCIVVCYHNNLKHI